MLSETEIKRGVISMKGEYLGHLPGSDPLSLYLKKRIFPQLGGTGRNGIRVFRTDGTNAVYIYEDRETGVRAVGKFFYSERMHDWDAAFRRLEREYRSIKLFRSHLDSRVHYTARPLGCNADLNRLLVVEYCQGERLDSVIRRTIGENNDRLLYGKLTALADFLVAVHNRSAGKTGIDFEQNCAYFQQLVRQVGDLIPHDEANYLHALCRQWHDDPVMWQDREVLVHGDATPSNFCFGDGPMVITFDLERVRRTDRLFDLGRLTAELRHFFFRSTGNLHAAEPFIGHFLWEYCGHFPDRERSFQSITGRLPFYMGMNLLRIARNSYLERSYRRALITEAEHCLKRRGS